MKNYNEELDKLFIEWENESEKLGFTKFCRDGLVLKGQISQGENGYWGRSSGS